MEHKELVEQLNQEWNALKGVLEQRDVEVKAFGTALGETKALIASFNERMNALELRLARPAGGGGPERKERGDAYCVFMKGLRKGFETLSPAEQKMLVVADDTTGGFGAPDELVGEIIKGTVDISPVRQLVSVRTTGQRSSSVMKRTGTFSALWDDEFDTLTETTGLAYGLEEIPTHQTRARVDVSLADLEDTAFNLEAELNQEFSEQFSKAEGTAVVSGNGKKRPEGFMSNAAISYDASGILGEVTFEGLSSIVYNGKAAYLPGGRYVLNLKTLGTIRVMKNGIGEPLWAPMAAGAPATINGYPYTVLPDMPDVGSNTYPVAFGDFKRAYRMVDRINIAITRDPYGAADKGAVIFRARKRLGGQVVLAEAIRKMKCAVS